MLFLIDDLEQCYNTYQALIADKDERIAFETTFRFCEKILLTGKIHQAERLASCKFSIVKKYIAQYNSCKRLAESIYFFDALSESSTEDLVAIDERKKNKALQLLRNGVSLSRVARVLGYKPEKFRKLIDNDGILAQEIYAAIADYELRLQSIMMTALENAARKGNVRDIANVVFYAKNADENSTTEKNPYITLFS